MTAIHPRQGLTSPKTMIENHDWSLQTTNLSMTKRPIIKTIQALYSFLFLKNKAIHCYSTSSCSHLTAKIST